MDKNQAALKENPKKHFAVDKKSFLIFIAGVAAAMLFAAGIQAAINPSMLTGSAVNLDQVVRYQFFPSNSMTAAIESEDRYIGEIVPIYTPKNFSVQESIILRCDGRQLSVNNDMALFAAVGTSYGVDSNFTHFNIPDYTKNQIDTNITYYITKSGLFPIPTSTPIAVADGIAYVTGAIPELLKNPQYYYSSSSSCCIGEIALFKTPDQNLLNFMFLPCEGQLLKASDYPEFARIFAPGQKVFTLPDLSDKSPIQGAEYYICINGYYIYQ